MCEQNGALIRLIGVEVIEMKKLICILLIVLLGTTAFAEAPGNSLGFATL